MKDTDKRKAPRGPGRPTSLTPEVQAAIVADVEAGVKFEDAALANGIALSTLKLWLQKADAGDERYKDFSAALTRARATAKANALRNVRAGMLPSKEPTADWKAEAWFLERTFPNEYGPQQAVAAKVQKELDAALDLLKAKLAPDVYDQVLNALAEEDGEGKASGAGG